MTPAELLNLHMAVDLGLAPDPGRRIYEALPEPVKARLTYAEWLWLPDADKATIVQRETEPDDL